MSKFKVRMKLQGFELEIEGSRDDVPLIAQNLTQQIAGLIQPAAGIVNGDKAASPKTMTIDHSSVEANGKKAKRRKRTTDAGGGDKPSAIEWRHDPVRWTRILRQGHRWIDR